MLYYTILLFFYLGYFSAGISKFNQTMCYLTLINVLRSIFSLPNERPPGRLSSRHLPIGIVSPTINLIWSSDRFRVIWGFLYS